MRKAQRKAEEAARQNEIGHPHGVRPEAIMRHVVWRSIGLAIVIFWLLVLYLWKRS